MKNKSDPVIGNYNIRKIEVHGKIYRIVLFEFSSKYPIRMS